MTSSGSDRRDRRSGGEGCSKDAVFEDYVAELGIDSALREYTMLHREIANRLIIAGITDPTVSTWARREVMTCARARHRRQQLRQMLRERDGLAAAAVVIDNLDREFPRVEV